MTGAGSLLLGLDTATAETVVAIGRPDGTVIGQDRWIAGHLHGERLLASIVGVLRDAGSALGDLGAIIVGTGPGSFTGMRVGVATAKGLAFGLGLPIVGVATAEALARAAAQASDTRIQVLQQAGPSARYRTVVGLAADAWLVEDGPVLEGAEDPPDWTADALEVAIEVSASPEALANGRRALAGLPGALIAAGRERLARHGGDDLAGLVPAYVSLPRGAVGTAEGVAWSHVRP